ncbi:DUF3857 domain-containing protein [bacterium AH-315-F18]|nr:DUF3857 domain-containing protein [bacterium AH-315-F18]
MSYRPAQTLFFHGLLWLGLLGVSSSVWAQAQPTDGVDHLARSEFVGAAQAALGQLEASLAMPAGPARDASAEYYLHRAVVMDGLHGRAKVVKPKLRALLDRLPKYAGAWARWYLAGHLHLTGDLAGLRGLEAELGFVDDWLIVGPFDNERGSGFDEVHPPENNFDAKAQYRGKDHKVSWWKPSVRPVFGEINLAAMLRPQQQTLAYAVTHIEVKEDTEVGIYVGSAGAIKLWVDGQPMLSRNVKRSMHFDQDAVGMLLTKGWHRIMVKSAVEQGRWGFRLRVAALDGSPLVPRPEVSATGEGLVLAKGAKHRKGVARGALAHYGSKAVLAAARAAKDHDTLFRLGYLRYHYRAHDENKHPARALFQECLKLKPGESRYSYALSHVASDRARVTVEKEENARRTALEQTLKSDPQHLGALAALAKYYLNDMKLPRRALGFIRRGLKVKADDIKLVRLHIGALNALGWVNEGRMAADTLLGSDAAKVEFSLLLWQARRDINRGRADLASPLLQRLHARRPANRGVMRIWARYLAGRGDDEGVAKVLARWRELYPYDPAPHHLEAARHEAHERWAKAAAACGAGLALAPQDVTLLERQGHNHYRAGQQARAMALWKKVLKLDPKRSSLDRYVRYLESTRKPFYTDHEVPLAKVMARGKAFGKDSGHPYAYLLRKTVDRINPDGTRRRYVQQVIRVLNERGVEEHDVLAAVYAQGEQRARVLRARVVHADGTRSDARLGEGGSSYESEVDTYNQILIDLPPLKAGDTIDFRYVVTDLRQSFFGDYFGERHIFQGSVPVAEDTYVLIAPKDRALYFHRRNLDVAAKEATSAEENTITRTWTLTDLTALSPEPDMPPVAEVAPCLEISTFSDWQAFGKWYWHLVKDSFEDNEALRAKVAELTSGAGNEWDKVRAIYNYVVTDIRYNDRWEFGVHGFKPYRATQVFTRKFGDCKDKANLIITMLKVVNIKAYPVLIEGEDLRGKEDYALPMMRHFNHCIAYVPEIDGKPGRFLDGTAEYHDAESLPSMDYGARVLVVSEGKGDLHVIPDRLAEQNLVVEERTIDIAVDGSAQVRIDNVATGDFAYSVRYSMATKGKRKRRLERMYALELPGVSVADSHFSDLKDLNAQVKYSVDLRVPRMAVSRGKVWSLAPVPVALYRIFVGRKMLSLAELSERKQDLLLGVATGYRTEDIIRLPAGTKIVQLPKNQTLVTPFGNLKVVYTEESDGAIKRTVELKMSARRVTVMDYAAYRSFLRSVDKALEARIEVTPPEEGRR